MTLALIVWTALQDESGRVLLARRSGTALADGLWNLPGGSVEAGEALADAARRELREEVGVEVECADLIPVGVSRYDTQDRDRRMQGVDFLFVARHWQGAPAPLDKTSEVGWFALDALPADLLPWLPRVLDTHLRRGEWLSEAVGEEL